MRRSSQYMVLAGLLALPLMTAGCEGGPTEDGLIAPGDQTSELESDLLQLREEEKLARDVYLTLHEEWGTNIFQMISGSEQRHMDEVKGLLDAFGIADPITDDTIGVFTNPELDALYDQLVEQGMASEVDGLLVGATIEDLDIFDIRGMRGNTDNAVVLEVYDKLECGSNNHMRAFTSQLSGYSTEYDAQFLTEAEFQEVLAADHESCGDGSGQGGGNH